MTNTNLAALLLLAAAVLFVAGLWVGYAGADSDRYWIGGWQ